MTLESISDVFAIVGSVAAATIALQVYFWTRRSEKNNQRRHSNNEMQTYNLTVLQDDKLLQMEADNHPYGEIGVEDARKMYRYFVWINIADNMRKSAENNLLDRDLAQSRLDNQARIAFPDRDFLETHVFPRGYEADLVEAFRKRWRTIENE